MLAFLTQHPTTTPIMVINAIAYPFAMIVSIITGAAIDIKQRRKEGSMALNVLWKAVYRVILPIQAEKL